MEEITDQAKQVIEGPASNGAFLRQHSRSSQGRLFGIARPIERKEPAAFQTRYCDAAGADAADASLAALAPPDSL